MIRMNLIDNMEITTKDFDLEEKFVVETQDQSTENQQDTDQNRQ